MLYYYVIAFMTIFLFELVKCKDYITLYEDKYAFVIRYLISAILTIIRSPNT